MSAELRPGYKVTAVGAIPEEWEVRFLDQCAQIRSGVAKNSNAKVTNPLRVHYLRVANVQDGFLDLSDMSEIEIDRADLQRFSVLPGDVLMNEGGDRDKLGRGCIWSGELSPCVHQNHVFVIRCQVMISPSYLTSWTRSSAAKQYFITAGSQTTNLASINKTALGQLPVPLPPTRAEQEAIAEALGDVDALLSALTQLIAKKRDLKQAAMQQLLTGRTRLPGFDSGKSCKQSEVGRIPEEWVVSRLGDLVDRSRGIRYGIVQPGKYEPQGRLMIRGQDYSRGWVDPSELFRVGSAIEERYKNARVMQGDLIITIVGAGTGYVEAVPDWLDGANLTQTTARIAIDSAKADSGFCKAVLQSSYGRNQVGGYVKGAAQPGLNCGDVEKFLLPLPGSKHEQRAIAAALSNMDAEITALEQRLGKTRALKQGMMQELLTGRTRLV